MTVRALQNSLSLPASPARLHAARHDFRRGAAMSGSHRRPPRLRLPAARRHPAVGGGSAAAAAADSSAIAAAAAGAPLLLWYKRDLRLDDHPGWQAAAGDGAAPAAPVLPVFCFDPERYAPLVLPRGGAEALCRALASLDASLRQCGSRLVVRVGPWEQQLPALAAQLGAAGVVAEAEVEAAWCDGVARVAAALPRGVAVQQWRAPLLDAHADDYAALKARRAGYNAPLPPPGALPPLPPGVEEAAGEGLGVSPGQLRQLAADAFAAGLAPPLAAAATALPCYGAAAPGASAGSLSGSFSDEGGAVLIERLVGGGGADGAPDAVQHGSRPAWEAGVAAEVAAGEGPVLAALGSYLRQLETAAAVGGELGADAALAAAAAAYDGPATPDGCFPALFGRALSLGVVSRRRVHAEAAAVLAAAPEQPWPRGFAPLRQLAWLLTSGGGAAVRMRRARKAAAAAAAAEARDFHEAMAAQREGRSAHGATLHHWRWRGLLTDYLAAPADPAAAAAAAAAGAERPAILLCHGFGAFSEHFRDNVAALAAAGYDVFAPTLPGYGRAEKPVLPYGQGLWTDFLADFVLQVARRPVVVAGNSIGGYVSASLAADYPDLVRGLVLINSAGRIDERYEPPAQPPAPSPPAPWVVDVVSQALFAFLEGNVSRQLRRVYPVRPQRADAWLGGEIARAARDPGALGVFRSVFYLPPPRPLNFLVASRFRGPTLVLQGLHDPLNDAPARANELAATCPNVEVVRLDAGHCPHDEVPELANDAILRFVQQRVEPAAAAAAEAAAQRAPAAAS